MVKNIALILHFLLFIITIYYSILSFIAVPLLSKLQEINFFYVKDKLIKFDKINYKFLNYYSLFHIELNNVKVSDEKNIENIVLKRGSIDINIPIEILNQVLYFVGLTEEKSIVKFTFNDPDFALLLPFLKNEQKLQSGKDLSDKLIKKLQKYGIEFRLNFITQDIESILEKYKIIIKPHTIKYLKISFINSPEAFADIELKYNKKLITGKLFKDKKDFGIKLQGENSDIKFSNTIQQFHIKKSFNTKISYSDGKWHYNSYCSDVKITKNSGNSINLTDINSSGIFSTRELIAEKLDFKVDNIPFIGKIDIKKIAENKYLNDIYLKLQGECTEYFVNQYWEFFNLEKIGDMLKKYITKSTIKGGNFNITYTREGGNYKTDDILLNLHLNDTQLEHSIDNNKHTIHIPNSDVNLDINGVKIISSNVALDNTINAKEFTAIFPFKKTENISLIFKLQSELQDLQKWYNNNFNEDDGIKIQNGNFSDNITIQIPYDYPINPQIKLSTAIDNLKIILPDTDDVIQSKKVQINIENNKWNLKGGLNYKNIVFNNGVFEGIFNLNGRDKITITKVTAKIPIKQKIIQLYIDRIDFAGRKHLHGDIKLDIDRLNNDFFDVKCYLDEMELEIPSLGLKKEHNEKGVLHIRSGKIFDIHKIKLVLPTLTIESDIIDINNKIMKFSVTGLGKNIFNVEYHSKNKKHYYDISGDALDLSPMVKFFNKVNVHEKVEKNNDEHLISMNFNEVFLDNKKVFEKVNFNLKLKNTVESADMSSYVGNKKGYLRMFYSKPDFALVVNNAGKLFSNLFAQNHLRKGVMEVKGKFDDNHQFKGYLFMNNFTLWRSHILSAILNIYSFSGNYINALKLLGNDGVEFKGMYCDIRTEYPKMFFNGCRAVSSVMLINADAIYDVSKHEGKIEGNTIPINFFNAMLIIMHDMFPKIGGNLLDGNNDRRNFTIILRKDKNALVKTNPLSFILPGALSQIFSTKKTIGEDFEKKTVTEEN